MGRDEESKLRVELSCCNPTKALGIQDHGLRVVRFVESYMMISYLHRGSPTAIRFVVAADMRKSSGYRQSDCQSLPLNTFPWQACLTSSHKSGAVLFDRRVIILTKSLVAAGSVRVAAGTVKLNARRSCCAL